jgi:uncharacterized protein YjfI (DUF2170 family)
MLKVILFLFIIPINLLAYEKYTIIIKNHQFFSNKITIPANVKVKLIIENQDDEVEEFESFDLRREKIVPSKSSVIIKIGPLSQGEYNFFGDFHIKTAQGVIIVK